MTAAMERGQQVRGAVLRLPPAVQRTVLRATGRLAPWDVGFDYHAPPTPAGLHATPPDFVGVGVQKTGTTWWHGALQSTLRPEIDLGRWATARATQPPGDSR